MERINFDDAKIGDKVKITRTKASGVVVTFEGTIERLTEHNIGLEPHSGFGRGIFEDNGYEIYLIDRPYALPTKPGLYTTMLDEKSLYFGSGHILQLDHNGKWDMWATSEAHEYWTIEELLQAFKESKTVLRRLPVLK